jgi:hypothetical protein
MMKTAPGESARGRVQTNSLELRLTTASRKGIGKRWSKSSSALVRTSLVLMQRWSQICISQAVSGGPAVHGRSCQHASVGVPGSCRLVAWFHSRTPSIGQSRGASARGSASGFGGRLLSLSAAGGGGGRQGDFFSPALPAPAVRKTRVPIYWIAAACRFNALLGGRRWDVASKPLARQYARVNAARASALAPIGCNTWAPAGLIQHAGLPDSLQTQHVIRLCLC